MLALLRLFSGAHGKELLAFLAYLCPSWSADRYNSKPLEYNQQTRNAGIAGVSALLMQV